MSKISIVIPCYNEEHNIPIIYEEILKHCDKFDLQIIFVNDGSRDKTKEKVLEIASKDKRVKLISFISNKGHQVALRAGLNYASADFIISMDSDMQHPPHYIPDMISKAIEGEYDCVNMIRKGIQEGVMKNFLSRNFYKLFSLISDVPVIPGASDFRLISKRVQNIIKQLPERQIVFRALIPYLGFKSCNMLYDLGKRTKGKPSYTIKKSLELGRDTIFNYTSFPYNLFFQIGLFVSILSGLYGIVIVFLKIFTDLNEPGYTDIVASVLFLGSLNLILLAVIGKYLHSILDHLRKRPEFIIDNVKGDTLDNKD